MKISVKVMTRNGEGFRYLQQKFPGISDAKIKEGTFVSPQIKELMTDSIVDEVPEGTEKTAREAFRLVLYNFLGNRKAPNCRQLVEEMLEADRIMGCNMSLKIFILTWISFQQTLETSATSMVQGFTRRVLPWRSATRGN
jgi:hypothetical protein